MLRHGQQALHSAIIVSIAGRESSGSAPTDLGTKHVSSLDANWPSEVEQEEMTKPQPAHTGSASQQNGKALA